MTWTTVNLQTINGVPIPFRVWDESHTGDGPFSFVHTVSDGASGVVVPATQATLASILTKLSGNPATEAKQNTIITNLTNIAEKLISAPANETNQNIANAALASILAKIIAAPATEAKQNDIITALNNILVGSTASITLLTDADTTGAGASQNWPGGIGLWSAWGDWDAASVQLQYSPATDVWIDVDGALLSDNGGVEVRMPAFPVRVDLAGAGAATLISSSMKRS